MKKLIYMFSFLMIISCNEEENRGNNNNDSTLPTLYIESIIQYLPLIAMEGKRKAVFVNSEGNKKEMKLKITKELVEKNTADKIYKTERIDIVYSDPETAEYSLRIGGSGNYLQGEAPNLFISGGITQFVVSPALFSLSEIGEPVLALHFDQKTIVHKTFDDVYTNYPIETQIKYSNIYYSKELGVVGFVDGKGDHYVLVELKE